MTYFEMLVAFALLWLITSVLAVVVGAQQFMIMRLNAAVRALANYLDEPDQ